MNANVEFLDDRRLPISVDYELDDMGLSLEAFRVYLHLCRRAGQKNGCFPSKATIAKTCFPDHSEERGKKKVTEAINQLVELRLIEKRKRVNNQGRQLSNVYILNDKSVWIKKTQTQGVNIAPGEGVRFDPQGVSDSTPPGGSDLTYIRYKKHERIKQEEESGQFSTATDDAQKQKKKKEKKEPSGDAIKLFEFFDSTFSAFTESNNYKSPTGQARDRAIIEADRMIRLDKVSIAEAKKVILFAKAELEQHLAGVQYSFRVESFKSFREKYQRIKTKSDNQKAPQANRRLGSNPFSSQTQGRPQPGLVDPSTLPQNQPGLDSVSAQKRIKAIQKSMGVGR